MITGGEFWNYSFVLFDRPWVYWLHNLQSSRIILKNSVKQKTECYCSEFDHFGILSASDLFYYNYL